MGLKEEPIKSSYQGSKKCSSTLKMVLLNFVLVLPCSEFSTLFMSKTQ